MYDILDEALNGLRAGTSAAPLSAKIRRSPSLAETAAVDPERPFATYPHSMTSSARARIDGGTVRPSAFAILRLITSSNVVGCCTGRSAGLAPLRIFPA